MIFSFEVHCLCKINNVYFSIASEINVSLHTCVSCFAIRVDVHPVFPDPDVC